MLTLFSARGLVAREGGVFRPTAIAREYLVGSSPLSLGPYLAALKDRQVCKDLVSVLRSGRPAGWCSVAGEDAWIAKMDDSGFATDFTAAMDARAACLAPALARKLDLRSRSRLLDVGGGSGVYACNIVEAHPHLRAAVLEKKPVDAVARERIAQRGFTDRVEVIAGDMFAELPTGFDVHLWSNVLHDWDVPEVQRLLRSSVEALPPGGAVLIHDAHLDADKSGPLPVAEFSVLLMHSTGGRCYSVQEMEEILRECGCSEVIHTDTAADRSVVVGTKGA